MTVGKRDIPAAVVQRLPQYLAYVREQKRRDHIVQPNHHIHSHEIANALGFTTSTVRQDFTHLSFEGGKSGYDIEQVDSVLTSVLGMDTEKRMVIVGAGNLGRALARRGNFGKHGFRIEGIFDSDTDLIGIKCAGFRVLGMDDLASFVQTKKVDIGVIAVPANSAQEVADLLILAGVRGLLNLAFTRVVVPRQVAVIDTRIVSSLMLLSCAMDD